MANGKHIAQKAWEFFLDFPRDNFWGWIVATVATGIGVVGIGVIQAEVFTDLISPGWRNRLLVVLAFLALVQVVAPRVRERYLGLRVENFERDKKRELMKTFADGLLRGMFRNLSERLAAQCLTVDVYLVDQESSRLVLVAKFRLMDRPSRPMAWTMGKGLVGCVWKNALHRAYVLPSDRELRRGD